MRRASAGLAACLLCVTVLGGCGRRELGEVVLVTHLDPRSGAYPADRALAEIIARFESENPGARVTVRTSRWDTMSESFVEQAVAAEQSSADDAPDLQWIPEEDLAYVVDSGALADLGRVLARRFWRESGDDLLLVERGREPVWTMPVGPACYGLIYRADLLRENGIQVPFASWEELLAAAEHLTAFDDVLDRERYGLGVGLAMGDADLPFAASLIAAAGGGLFEAARRGETPAPTWTGEEGREALVFMGRLAGRGVIHPEAADHNAEEVYRAFAGGTYGMVFAPTSRLRRMRLESIVADPPDLRFAAVPPPGSGRDGRQLVESWHVGLRRASPRKRTARVLLAYLVSAEADRLWVSVGEQLPLRRSTTDTVAPDRLPDPVAVAALRGGVLRAPAEVPSRPWRRALGRAVRRAVLGGESIPAALAEAERAVQESIEGGLYE